MPPLRAMARPGRAAPWALALVAAACAGASPRPETAAEPVEVLVELLPSRAVLTVDGARIGQGGRVLRLGDPARSYRLRASAPGFVPAERLETGAQLAGARVVLALRPDGNGGGDGIDGDDAVGLALAAESLLHRGDREAAREYARRAAALAPDRPLVRRVMAEVGWSSAERTIEIRRPAGSER